MKSWSQYLISLLAELERVIERGYPVDSYSGGNPFEYVNPWTLLQRVLM